MVSLRGPTFVLNCSILFVVYSRISILFQISAPIPGPPNPPPARERPCGSSAPLGVPVAAQPLSLCTPRVYLWQLSHSASAPPGCTCGSSATQPLHPLGVPSGAQPVSPCAGGAQGPRSNKAPVSWGPFPAPTTLGQGQSTLVVPVPTSAGAPTQGNVPPLLTLKQWRLASAGEERRNLTPVLLEKEITEKLLLSARLLPRELAPAPALACSGELLPATSHFPSTKASITSNPSYSGLRSPPLPPSLHTPCPSRGRLGGSGSVRAARCFRH